MPRKRVSHEPIAVPPPRPEPPPRPGSFYRSDDGRTWLIIGVDDLKRRFGGTFGDVCAAISVMVDDGEIVRTAAARYQFAEVAPVDGD